MTITHERAKALLDASGIKGATVAAESLAGERLPEVTDCGDGSTIADPSTPAVADLMAAAPHLARTVIDQAEEIEQLRSTVAAFINKRTECITALLNSPEANADYWRWQGHAESRRQLAQALGWMAPHNPGETTIQEADQ